jgi:hypothetical protein
MTEIDLMTPMERKRKERNEAIIAEFKELAPTLTAQGYKPYRIMQALAKKFGITTPGVRFVLVKAGVYETAEKVSKSF